MINSIIKNTKTVLKKLLHNCAIRKNIIILWRVNGEIK